MQIICSHSLKVSFGKTRVLFWILPSELEVEQSPSQQQTISLKEKERQAPTNNSGNDWDFLHREEKAIRNRSMNRIIVGKKPTEREREWAREENKTKSRKWWRKKMIYDTVICERSTANDQRREEFSRLFRYAGREMRKKDDDEEDNTFWQRHRDAIGCERAKRNVLYCSFISASRLISGEEANERTNERRLFMLIFTLANTRLFLSKE